MARRSYRRPPGTFVLDLAVAAQAFVAAPPCSRKIREQIEPPYDVRVCGAVALGTSLGFSMSQLGPLTELAAADTVVVPGLEAPWVPQDLALLEALAAAAARGARMVSLCAGAFCSAKPGSSTAGRVTTHWALAEEFRARSRRQSSSSTRCTSTTDRCCHPAGCRVRPTCASTSSGSTTARPTPTTCRAS